MYEIDAHYLTRIDSQELSSKADVQYVPGGATQNSIRIAQWLLQVHNMYHWA